MYIRLSLTNFIFGPSPNSAWKRPKFVSHAGHFAARHVLGGMPQWQDAWRARGGHAELAALPLLQRGALAHRLVATSWSCTRKRRPELSPTVSSTLYLVLALFILSSTAMAERLSILPAASACRTPVLPTGSSRPSAASRSRG